MHKLCTFFLSTLLFLQMSLSADWTKSLGNLQKSDSVKKSYLNGMLAEQSYGIYEVKHLKSTKNVKELYKNNESKLYWFEEDGNLNQNISNMIESIRLSENEGLNQNRYHLDEIEFLFKKMSNSMLFDDRDYNLASTKMDILLSDAFFTLVKDLTQSQIDYTSFKNILYKIHDEEDIDYRWEAKPQKVDYFKLLQELMIDGDFVAGIYANASENVIYNNLKNAYLRYKSVQEQGGFQKIKSGKNLKVGSVSSRVIELRQRLNQSGDLGSFDETNNKFDNKLKIALKKFQKRVGIWPSGILNSTTQKELNIPIKKRLKMIKLNLERSRWEGSDLSYVRFIINIPEFKMRFMDGNKLLLDSRVIVGKKKNPTPIFKSYMTYIVLNPTWSVPNSIVAKELLEKIQDDPYYLEDRNYKIYDGWNRKRKMVDSFDIDWFDYDKESKIPFNIVKDPGSSNPLGNVKFMFPNNYAVYMHDTPTKNLFKKSVRAYSHGCIRLHNPQKLLKFVSKDYLESSYESIKLKLDSGENYSISLNKKIPVYVRYYTAYVDENGGVVFSKDIYGYDKIHYKLLQKNK